ncbi:MAG: hypothetical protein AB7S38_25095 [Vulcanimicrobiota bacterium]
MEFGIAVIAACGYTQTMVRQWLPLLIVLALTALFRPARVVPDTPVNLRPFPGSECRELADTLAQAGYAAAADESYVYVSELEVHQARLELARRHLPRPGHPPMPALNGREAKIARALLESEAQDSFESTLADLEGVEKVFVKLVRPGTRCFPQLVERPLSLTVLLKGRPKDTHLLLHLQELIPGDTNNTITSWLPAKKSDRSPRSVTRDEARYQGASSSALSTHITITGCSSGLVSR